MPPPFASALGSEGRSPAATDLVRLGLGLGLCLPACSCLYSQLAGYGSPMSGTAYGCVRHGHCGTWVHMGVIGGNAPGSPWAYARLCFSELMAHLTAISGA